MSYLPGINSQETLQAPNSPQRPRAVTALMAVICLELAGFAAATAFLVFEVINAPADSVASAIALTICVAIATAWLAFIVRGVANGKAWTRGATIVIQVLLIAVAVGSFQGLVPRPDIGWLLLLPSIAAIVLLLTKPAQGWLKN